MKKLLSSIVLLSSLIMALSSCAKVDLNSEDTSASNGKSGTAAQYDKAALYLQQGKLEKALTEYKTITKNSESNRALLSEGNVLMTLGRFEEALLPLKEACEQNSYTPKSSFAMCDFIICLTALKKYDEALKNVERCGSEFDRYSDFVVSRALSLMALNRDEEALLRLEQLCRDTNDTDARSYYLRAVALRKLKRTDEAKRVLNIATLIYPEAIKMKSGKRMSPITTPLYADCAELFIQLDRPDRAVQTIALADVLGERGVRMTVLDSLARAKMGEKTNLQKAEKLIATEKQFWKDLK